MHKSRQECIKEIELLKKNLENIKMIKHYEEQIKELQRKIETNQVAIRLKEKIKKLEDYMNTLS